MENPEIILNKVETIQKKLSECKTDEDRKTVREEFRDFGMSYPAIFENIMQGTLDMKQFNYMINMAKKVKSNEKSQHDASVEVGQKLVDKYVKPVVKKK